MADEKPAQLNNNRSQAEMQKAIRLPNSYALSICLQTIKTRLGRSIITGTGTILGIAFLVSVLVSGNITESVAKSVIDDSEKIHQNWLVVMSLLVSTVGIANSMLMSVTERFKEIGTMKCLGALDKLIVKLFLMESGILGFIGSLSGAVLGFLFASIPPLFKYRMAVFTELNWSMALRDVLLAVALGTFLSIIATVYPAYRAAKLPPAAAMRSEI